MTRYLIGMDCGTTNIKAIIMSEEGKRMAEASRPSTFLNPGPNMHEQDANEWWKQAKEIFHSLMSQVDIHVAENICGLSISSHTVSMLPLDKDGQPLRNALTYQDGRSARQMYQILVKMGFDHFVNTVGGQPSVAFLPCKLLWFKENEPELFEKTECFLQASSFINFKLTGQKTTDIDQASRTQCLDMNTMEWSKEIGDIIGIDLDRYLPKPVPVDEIIGYVTQQASFETGLPEGIPVVAGCSDAMASMYATGLSKLGEAGESSGTTSLVFIGSEVKSSLDVPVVTRPCSIDGIPWIFDAPIQTSGAALKWFIDSYAINEKIMCEQNKTNIYNYLNERALETSPGSNGLFFFPYLLGERAPLWNDYARGMFIGLSMDTSKDDLIRSVFEGTAYALRHVVETVKESGGRCDALRICGGGAKSKTWSKIKASMLHCPVYLLNEESGDVPVGDVLIVGHKLGIFPDLTKAVESIVKVDEVIEPDPEWEEIYDILYPYFVSMYNSLDPNLRALRADLEKVQALLSK